MSDAGKRRDLDVLTKTRPKPKVKRPRRFRVLLYNDDYTNMEFVVAILQTIFRHAPAESVRIMLQVHESGSGVAGVFPFEIAEAKVLAVHDRAASAGYPLRAGLEEE